MLEICDVLGMVDRCDIMRSPLELGNTLIDSYLKF